MADKYKVIVNELELELKRMRSEGKTKLPSEMDLCSAFSCSRQTVRAALDVLLAKGLIVKRAGSGSYIADDVFANRTVYFLTEDTDRYETPALISGIRSELEPLGYDLRVFPTQGSYNEERNILLNVMEERPVAVIIEPFRDLIPDPNDRLIEEIMSYGIPVIYCNSAHTVSGANYAVPDFRKAGKLLTEELIGNGKTNIACIFQADSSSGTERYQGYIDALADSGITFDETRCLLINYQDKKDFISGDSKHISRFVSEKLKDCDSVICQDGMTAHQLISLLHRNGISVPDDITVACFDNGFYSSRSGEEMVTLGLNSDLIARSVSGLVRSSAEGKRPKNIVMNF